MRPNLRNEVSGAGMVVSLVFMGVWILALACATAEVHDAVTDHEAQAMVRCASTYDPGECRAAMLDQVGD